LWVARHGGTSGKKMLITLINLSQLYVSSHFF
jgi:hypothetical protein